MIIALLRRYLTDDVLQAAYEEVTFGTQKPEEEESQIADRLSKATCECRHVFEERELGHHFVRGRLRTHAVVTETVRRMIAFESCDMTVVRCLASAERTT